MRRVVVGLVLTCVMPRVGAGQNPPKTLPDSVMELVSQDKPCQGQPRTYRALRREYNAGRSTAREPLLGTWALIGDVAEPQTVSVSPETVLLNCAGVRQGPLFYHVLTIERNSVINEQITNLRWNPANPRESRTHDAQGNLTFLAESGGDDVEVYHCRLSTRGTLLCVEYGLHYGLEFKRMPVPAAQRPGAYYLPPS